MMDVQEPSTIPPPPPLDDDEMSDEGEYFYPSSAQLVFPGTDDDEGLRGQSSAEVNTSRTDGADDQEFSSDRRAFLNQPSPVRKSSRRLSFPLQKSDLEDQDQAADYASPIKVGRNALHEDQDEIFRVMTPPSYKSPKKPRSNSTGTLGRGSSRRKKKKPKAPDSQNRGKKLVMCPSTPVQPRSDSSIPSVLEDQLQTPPKRRRSSMGGGGASNHQPSGRRRPSAGGGGAASHQPSECRRSSVGGGGASNQQPERRRSSVGGGGASNHQPSERKRSSVGGGGAASHQPSERRRSSVGAGGASNHQPSERRRPSVGGGGASKERRGSSVGGSGAAKHSERRRSSVGGGGASNHQTSERKRSSLGGGGAAKHSERRRSSVGGGGPSNHQPSERRGSSVGEVATGSHQQASRRRSSVGGGGAGNHQPSEHKRSSVSSGGTPKKQPPPRRRSSVGLSGGVDRVKDQPPLRRGSISNQRPSQSQPRRSTMDATSSWQPRPPQMSRRRSSMPSKPNATELFYVDPFATTSKEKQEEEGKKIEEERITRRNSLPSASEFNNNTIESEQYHKTVTRGRMRATRSEEFDTPFVKNGDDPYDDEGNLIRTKAPRRRSVTNTPQRVKALDTSTTTPVVFTPDDTKTLNMAKNLEEAMEIDPFEVVEESMLNSDLSFKPFPGSRSDDEHKAKLKKEKKKKKKKKRKSLSGHLRKNQTNGEKSSKELASMESKNSANEYGTAGSTESAQEPGLPTSDFKLAQPHIEQLKGGDEDYDYEEFREGRRFSNSSTGSKEPIWRRLSNSSTGSKEPRRFSNSSTGSKEPRRRSKGRMKKTKDDDAPEPSGKKSFLRRMSKSPKRGIKKEDSGRILPTSILPTSLNMSIRSRDSSDDDDDLISSTVPRRNSFGSKGRLRRMGSRTIVVKGEQNVVKGEKSNTKLAFGSLGLGSAKKRKPTKPSRCKSDLGPRAIRISMSGDLDLLSSAESKELGIRRRRGSMSKGEVETTLEPSESANPLKSMSLSRVPAHSEQPQRRLSGSSSRRRFSASNLESAALEQAQRRPSGSGSRLRFSASNTENAALLVETEHLSDFFATTRLPSKAQKRSISPKRKPKFNRLNSTPPNIYL